MSQAPTSEALSPAYEPPKNTQFGIFLENRVGKLVDLLDVFDGHAITLAGYTVIEAADHAVVRLLTSRADLARRLLERASMQFGESEVLVVEIDGRRSMAKLCRALLAAELSIHYSYPLLVRPRGIPAIVLRTDDPILAAQILRQKFFTLLGENDLGDNASRGTPGTPNDPEG